MYLLNQTSCFKTTFCGDGVLLRGYYSVQCLLVLTLLASTFLPF